MTNFEGFDDLSEQLQLLAEELETASYAVDGALDDATEETALQVERSGKENAPVDTGTLRSSIDHQRVDIGEFVVGTNLEYGPDVEYGTDAHVISANGDDPMTFQVDGQWISKYSVDHPGTPAQPFLRPALREHKSDLEKNIRRAIGELFGEVFR